MSVSASGPDVADRSLGDNDVSTLCAIAYDALDCGDDGVLRQAGWELVQAGEAGERRRDVNPRQIDDLDTRGVIDAVLLAEQEGDGVTVRQGGYRLMAIAARNDRGEGQ